MNLALFKRPTRYTGNEINIIRKDAKVRIALCFPDTYEVGMSHLGLKILYEIINSIPCASAERVFAPWVDLESYLIRHDIPLTSLENKRPLRDFDVVGFTLQYELSYTNILNILRLGKIPLRSDERERDDPIIIAGGPCAFNPLPLSPFIDAFVIGDGEEIIREIVSICNDLKGMDRQEILEGLSGVEGIYVPLIHDTKKVKIRRRIVQDLDGTPFPESPIVPYAPIVHDRVTIEISRGCTRGCRFCQAGMIYRPVRERSVRRILEISERSLLNTGYDEVSFTSLSTGDYSSLHTLIKGFNMLFSDRYIAVSLPSLRVGAIDQEILEEIKKVRKTGFTIAPEAGTPRLRDVINKDFTEDEYERTLKILFEEGWRHVKLYFMIGLPTETEADLNGIINMVRTGTMIGRAIWQKGININVSVSAFVPKPHTPFQWTGQLPYNELKERQAYLKKNLKRKGINFKGHDLGQSLLEAVFSRGDERCAVLLENAYSEGCRFDGWTELFDFDKWLRASERAGIDLFKYASRHFEADDELPWEFIDTGIKRESLINEYKNSTEGKRTEDCRKVCYGCGLDCKKWVKGPEEEPISHIETGRRTQKIQGRMRLRVRYSKKGTMRYLSHQELMTAILRAARRAEIPLVHTSGFHPHPVVSFGPALPAGVEGMNEYIDIEIHPLMSPEEFKWRLNSKLPEGIEILEAIRIDRRVRALNDVITCYVYEVEIGPDDPEAVSNFMNKATFTVTRKDKKVDIRRMVKDATIHGNTLRLILMDEDNHKVRLFEILQALLSRPLEYILGLRIKRTGLYSYNIYEREKTWQAK